MLKDLVDEFRSCPESEEWFQSSVFAETPVFEPGYVSCGPRTVGQ